MASNSKDSPSQNESNHRHQHLTRAIALPLRPLPKSGRSQVSLAPREGLRSPESSDSALGSSSSPMNSLQLHAGNSREEYGPPQYLQDGDVVIIAGVPPGSFIGYDTVGL
ncbi:hypothetical protein V498_08735, partial [Pseudogymnoascus sp. VKM F-4517 (FW-2822)]